MPGASQISPETSAAAAPCGMSASEVTLEAGVPGLQWEMPDPTRSTGNADHCILRRDSAIALLFFASIVSAKSAGQLRIT